MKIESKITLVRTFIILATIFCFCLSLFAAEGEAEQEKKKVKWPNWRPANLFYGPVLMSNVFFVPIAFIGPFVGAPQTLYYPLIVPFAVVDGALHTATFGLFFSHEDDDSRHDFIGDLFFVPIEFCKGNGFVFDQSF